MVFFYCIWLIAYIIWHAFVPYLYLFFEFKLTKHFKHNLFESTGLFLEAEIAQAQRDTVHEDQQLSLGSES